MSANAVIKCSDCGGDVILAQLGEHVCNPSQPTSIPQKEEVEVIIDELATKPQELGRPPEPTKPRELSQLLGPSKTLEPIKPLETRQPSEPTILSEPSQPLDSSREIPEPSKFPEPIKRSEPPKPRVDGKLLPTTIAFFSYVFFFFGLNAPQLLSTGYHYPCISPAYRKLQCCKAPALFMSLYTWGPDLFGPPRKKL